MNSNDEEFQDDFHHTLEDTKDDARRKNGKLHRRDIENINLTGELEPVEFIAIDTTLSQADIELVERDQSSSSGAPNEANSKKAEVPPSLKFLMQHVNNYPPLTFQEELEFAEIIQSSLNLTDDCVDLPGLDILEKAKFARDTLILSNITLVIKYSLNSRFKGLMEIDDIVQNGFLGLIRATERYDPAWETRFFIYASWWIYQSITRVIADEGKTIRIPVHLQSKISLYNETKKMYQYSDDAIDEISKKLRWTPEYTAKISSYANQTISSLDAPIEGESEVTIKYTLESNAPNPEDIAITENDENYAQNLLFSLDDPRLIDILSRRYGIGRTTETQQEIADDYEVSRERIRQLEKKAIEKLRLKAKN